MNELAIRQYDLPPTSYFPDHINDIFNRINPQDVEQFYKSYQLWSIQRQIEILQIEIEALQHAVADNRASQQQISPSAIVLACLAQLQAYGVEDFDLLERMLERGEAWLDHTMQLLKHCEELNIISISNGDYTQWCEHALEGAYDWITSMDGTEQEDPQELSAQNRRKTIPLDMVTEERLLQKLMSDEEETDKLPAISQQLTANTTSAVSNKITINFAELLAAEAMLIASETITIPNTPDEEIEEIDEDITLELASIPTNYTRINPKAKTLVSEDAAAGVSGDVEQNGDLALTLPTQASHSNDIIGTTGVEQSGGLALTPPAHSNDIIDATVGVRGGVERGGGLALTQLGEPSTSPRITKKLEPIAEAAHNTAVQETTEEELPEPLAELTSAADLPIKLPEKIDDSTEDTSLTISKHEKLPAPKVQRRGSRSFWRRLLARILHR